MCIDLDAHFCFQGTKTTTRPFTTSMSECPTAMNLLHMTRCAYIKKGPVYCESHHQKRQSWPTVSMYGSYRYGHETDMSHVHACHVCLQTHYDPPPPNTTGVHQTWSCSCQKNQKKSQMNRSTTEYQVRASMTSICFPPNQGVSFVPSTEAIFMWSARLRVSPLIIHYHQILYVHLCTQGCHFHPLLLAHVNALHQCNGSNTHITCMNWSQALNVL